MSALSSVSQEPLRKVDELTASVDGVHVFYRRVRGEGPPVVFAHGNPTSSEEWLPFLTRMEGGAIAPDFPGSGRSARPRGFDYTMHGQAAFIERFLHQLGVEEYSLVVHDWGTRALIAALNAPQRVRRLVVIDAVPLLPGYRWHRTARLWRRPIVGELTARPGARSLLALGLREARPGFRPMPPEFVDMVWRHWDRGMAGAMLELYRSADPQALAAAGERLGEISAPALVVWGERDPYLPARFGAAYAERLPDAELLALPDAGHWPWIDRPDVIETVLRFLAG